MVRKYHGEHEHQIFLPPTLVYVTIGHFKKENKNISYLVEARKICVVFQEGSIKIFKHLCTRQRGRTRSFLPRRRGSAGED